MGRDAGCGSKDAEHPCRAHAHPDPPPLAAGDGLSCCSASRSSQPPPAAVRSRCMALGVTCLRSLCMLFSCASGRTPWRGLGAGPHTRASRRGDALMVLEVGPIGRRPYPTLTGEGPLVAVHPPCFFKSGRADERLAAHLAAVGLIARVDLQVLLQMGLRGEALGAHLAHERRRPCAASRASSSRPSSGTSSPYAWQAICSRWCRTAVPRKTPPLAAVWTALGPAHPSLPHPSLNAGPRRF